MRNHNIILPLKLNWENDKEPQHNPSSKPQLTNDKEPQQNASSKPQLTKDKEPQQDASSKT